MKEHGTVILSQFTLVGFTEHTHLPEISNRIDRLKRVVEELKQYKGVVLAPLEMWAFINDKNTRMRLLLRIWDDTYLVAMLPYSPDSKEQAALQVTNLRNLRRCINGNRSEAEAHTDRSWQLFIQEVEDHQKCLKTHTDKFWRYFRGETNVTYVNFERDKAKAASKKRTTKKRTSKKKPR